uniref:Phosphodiesterase 4D n=1 Tax=Monodon monoceros TaxID=40151 RepID=A0A8C6AN25_MONMO
ALPPRTFYVHKQKSQEQLRRISSNSLTGCRVALTKASLAVASLHVPLPCELGGDLWQGIGRGGVTFKRLPPWSALASSTPSPVSAERLRQATERTSSGTIRPASPDISPRVRGRQSLERGQGTTLPWIVANCTKLTGKMAQQTASTDTLTVPEVDNPHCPNPWLNEDLVKSLRENLLQHEKSKTARKSVSPKLSPVISPRNSPRLLRRMLLSSNIPKQRRFTVAHTW